MNDNFIKKGLLLVGAGAALACSMPGLGIAPLVFVSLVPLFVATEKGCGFLSGFIVGLVFLAIDLRFALTLYRFSPLAVVAYCVVVVLLAVSFGLFAIVFSWLRKNVSIGTLLIAAPASFAAIEMLRSLGPLGVGFSSLYQALYKFPFLIQIVAYAGPWALSACIVFVNVAIYLAIRKSWGYYVFAVAMIVLLIGFSFARLPEDDEKLSVAVISSTVSQEEKLGEETLFPLLDRYISLGMNAAESDPDLVVFPESILPGYILRNEQLQFQFAQLARRANARLVFGTSDYRNRNYYNSVAVMSADGKINGIYDMTHLVPFGEYIPARELLEWAGLGELIDSFLPLDITVGNGFYPVDGIGTPMCFESMFPAPAREFVANAVAGQYFGKLLNRRGKLILIYRLVSNLALKPNQVLLKRMPSLLNNNVLTLARKESTIYRKHQLMLSINQRN